MVCWMTWQLRELHYCMNITWFHGMKQNEHRGSWLSVVKNSWKSDKQLHCWDCFRAKSSSNSCLFWPLIVSFFLRWGNRIFFKKRMQADDFWVRKNSCPSTIVVFWLKDFSFCFSPLFYSQCWLRLLQWEEKGKLDALQSSRRSLVAVTFKKSLLPGGVFNTT